MATTTRFITTTIREREGGGWEGGREVEREKERREERRGEKRERERIFSGAEFFKMALRIPYSYFLVPITNKVRRVYIARSSPDGFPKYVFDLSTRTLGTRAHLENAIRGQGVDPWTKMIGRTEVL